MRLKKFLLLFCASLLVGGVLAVCLTPFVVRGGLRLWIWRVARQEGLRIEFARIEAPLLRPVVLHKLQVTSQEGTPFRVMIEASRIELELNFATLVSRARGRFLRSLTAETITADIRRNPQPPSAPQDFAWRILDDLLADNFKLSGMELHVENGNTVVDLHGGMLSGAQIEAGVFSASDLTIASPWFRKSFSNLRGATAWQENRLTIGALTLTRGLDLTAISVDFKHIGESRLDLEMAMDAFGGKLSAFISSEGRGDKRTWDAAGKANEISLAQMSDALELTDRAGGSLHACKFTFRGEVTNFREATASIWAEVTGLTWRDRTADSIMIGASLYNRQVQVEQLFVKQRSNQFTLTGESALPQKWSDWLNPDFHGDISASINDLGDFARLFGAGSSAFAGKIDIAGSVNARERKLGGRLSASGSSLILFRAPFESLKMEINLEESRLEIASFELRRKNDSFQGQASLDPAGDRKYSFNFTSAIADVGDYTALLPEALQAVPLGGSLDLEWTGTGTEAAHSGTFRASGHGIQPLGSNVIPVEAEFEGEYSPDGVYFRQFNLSNPHAAFSAFVTVAKDYFQLQTLRFDLNGKPKLQGNVFAPVSLSKIFLARSNWLDALTEDSNFDLDLTVEPTDLAELAGAVMTGPKMLGQAAGNIEIYGTPASLEGKSFVRLRDFVFENAPRISADVEARISHGIVNGKATLNAPGSAPVNFDGSIPLKLEKRESGFVVETNGPLFATLNFPAIFLARLPLYLSRRMFVDGILSGQLTVSDSLRHPHLLGNVQLSNGRFLGNSSISTGITFGGQTATIDFIQFAQNKVRRSAHGSIDFRELAGIETRIFPSEPVVALLLPEPGDCVSGIDLSPVGAGGFRRLRIDELDFRGSLFGPDWTISLSEKRADDPLELLLRSDSSRTFPICRDSQATVTTLTLGVTWHLFP